MGIRATALCWTVSTWRSWVLFFLGAIADRIPEALGNARDLDGYSFPNWVLRQSSDYVHPIDKPGEKKDFSACHIHSKLISSEHETPILNQGPGKPGST